MLRTQDKRLFISRQVNQLLNPDPPAPYFFALGSGLESINTGSIPSRHADTRDGDIELVIIESAAAQPAVISTSGWSQVSGSPQQASDTTLSVWWHRFATGDGLPQITDSGDHQVGYLFAFRGCTHGPIHAAFGGIDNTADTSADIPGGTTTLPNCLIVAICTSGRDLNDNTNFSAWTNADLLGVQEQFDRTSAIGGGGGFGFATGVKRFPGTYGTTAVTLATSQAKAMMSIALR